MSKTFSVSGLLVLITLIDYHQVRRLKFWVNEGSVSQAGVGLAIAHTCRGQAPSKAPRQYGLLDSDNNPDKVHTILVLISLTLQIAS